jgi:hypothetical protein
VPEAGPHAAEVQTPEAVLAALAATGGVLALLGDRDPVALVGDAARSAGRSFAHVDSRGLTTSDFDPLVRGAWTGKGWRLGALSTTMEDGGVFLMAHGETLLDDLRQRICRTMLTGKVLLRGPLPEADRTVSAVPGTTMILHVDDHQPMLLQVYTQLKLFPSRIRADVDGPPPVARR